MSKKSCSGDSMKEREEVDPFALIEKGNSLESSRNKWGSSEYYSRAASSLLREYHTINRQVLVSRTKEKKKIAALYHDQYVEYLNKARQCLIGALMFEREEDLKRWGDSEPMVDRISNGINDEQQFDPFMNLLNDEEKEKRMNTFRRLFVSPYTNDAVTDHVPILKDDCNNKNPSAKVDIVENENDEVESIEHGTTAEIFANNENEILEKRLNSLESINNVLNHEKREEHLTLEQRLARLDSTLPESSKRISDDERLEKVKGGLNDLGVYVPSHNIQNTLNEQMSDDEQIEMIISMAKDEAALDNKLTGDGANNESVDELMKKSGIRFDLPSCHQDDDVLLDPNDAELAFWSSLDINDTVNEETTKITDGGDRDDDDNDMYRLRDTEDFKRCINKIQQMLLQANVCLDEIDFTKSSNKATSTVKTQQKNESTILEEKEGIIQNHVKSESEREECKKTNIDGNKQKFSSEDPEQTICDPKGLEIDMNKEYLSEHNIVSEMTGQDDQGDNPNSHDAISQEKRVNNDEECDKDDQGDNLISHDATSEEKRVNSDKECDNFVKDDKVSLKSEEDNSHEGCESYDSFGATCVSTADMERLKRMGRTSVLRAHVMLQRILEAWPEEK